MRSFHAENGMVPLTTHCPEETDALPERIVAWTPSTARRAEFSALPRSPTRSRLASRPTPEARALFVNY